MSEYKNPVCRGSYMLGTACGRCERCIEENPVSKIEALKSENQSLRAEMRALKDELDRTTDALIHQGKTLRKTTENLLKMSNKKDAEIQRLREEIAFIKEYLNPADTSFRQMIDAFRVLTKEEQEKMVNLCKSLVDLQSEPGKGEG